MGRVTAYVIGDGLSSCSVIEIVLAFCYCPNVPRLSVTSYVILNKCLSCGLGL